MVLVAILVMAAIVAGCSGSKAPKAALQDAMLSTMEAGSYKLSMTMQVDELELPPSADAATGGMPAVNIGGIIKDALMNVEAVYSKDSKRTDMTLELVLPGMMNMTLAVPIIIAEQKVYLKLPAIPLLPIPAAVTDKYIEVDLKELAERQGDGASIDIEAQQKLSQELSVAVLKHFDEKTYFSEIKAGDANLPEGVKADQVVKFAITEENYPKTVETLVNQVIPEVLDILLANEAYLKTLNVAVEDLESAKANLESNKTEALNVLQNNVKLNVLELTGAIQGKHLVYQDGRIGVDATDPDSGENMKLGLSFSIQYSDIGKEVTFENELPTETITIDQLMAMLQSPNAT